MRTRQQIIEDTKAAIVKVAGEEAGEAFVRNLDGNDLPDSIPSHVVGSAITWHKTGGYDFWESIFNGLVAWEQSQSFKQPTNHQPTTPQVDDEEVRELWKKVFLRHLKEGYVVEDASSIANKSVEEFKKRFK
jgi:hypothetical protein